MKSEPLRRLFGACRDLGNAFALVERGQGRNVAVDMPRADPWHTLLATCEAGVDELELALARSVAELGSEVRKRVVAEHERDVERARREQLVVGYEALERVAESCRDDLRLARDCLGELGKAEPRALCPPLRWRVTAFLRDLDARRRAREQDEASVQSALDASHNSRSVEKEEMAEQEAAKTPRSAEQASSEESSSGTSRVKASDSASGPQRSGAPSSGTTCDRENDGGFERPWQRYAVSIACGCGTFFDYRVDRLPKHGIPRVVCPICGAWHGQHPPVLPGADPEEGPSSSPERSSPPEVTNG